MIWLAYTLPNRPFDDAFFDDARDFLTTCCHVAPTDEQLRALIAEPF